MKMRLAPLLALAALAVAVPSASALTMTDYKVTIEGSASYSRTDVGPGAFGNWVQSEKTEFSWKTEMPSVTFIDNVVATAAGSKVTGTVKSGSMDISIPTPEGPVTGSCTGRSWAEMPGPGIITSEKHKPAGAANEGIFLSVLAGGSIKLDQCSGALGTGPVSIGVGGTGGALQSNPWEQFFEMPHEAIGMGKIIQLLTKENSGVKCPGYYDMTEHCSLSWKATVTFVRTSHTTTDEMEDLIPTPPAPPQDPAMPAPLDPTEPAPPTPPTPQLPPRDDMDDLLIPLPNGAKLDKHATKAILRVLCPTGCTGTAVATAARGAKARAAAKAKPLARTRFTAPAGRPATVTLRFGARARRAIRRAGGIKVALDVTPKGGARRRKTVAIAVR